MSGLYGVDHVGHEGIRSEEHEDEIHDMLSGKEPNGILFCGFDFRTMEEESSYIPERAPTFKAGPIMDSACGDRTV